MVLLCKKEAVDVKDYMPIKLIHNFSKMVAKRLSPHLVPYMHELVMPNQSTFIRGHAIHDNFRMVWSTAKLLHAHKLSPILLKVDMAK
jgi:hypothetical protein